MAERIPPIVVKVESKFDPKGINAAKRQIKNFSTTAEKDLSKSENKFNELKKAWETYSSSLNKNNKKVKKSMDAVSASFERVEKASKRVQDANTAKAKAELTIENKRIRLAEKRSKFSEFTKGGNLAKVAADNAVAQLKDVYAKRKEAIIAAKKDEEKLLGTLEDKSLKEAKAKLDSSKAEQKTAKHLAQLRALLGQQKAAEEALKTANIRKVETQDGGFRFIDLNTGELVKGNKLVENLVNAERNVQEEAIKAKTAIEEQQVAVGKLNKATKARASAENQYNQAKAVTTELETRGFNNEISSIAANVKNDALAKQKKLSSDVVVAENELKSAEETLEKSIRDVAAAEKDYNVEIGKTVGVTQNATDNVTRLTGAMSQVKNAANSVISGVKKLHQKIRSINFTSIIAKFYSITRITSFLNSFVEASSDWIENLNLLEVVYNDTATAADEVKDKISDLSETFRMDINALAQYVSVFKQMANAMGQTAEVGSQMAEVLSLIALDVSSLRNVDVQTVVSDFTGALAGQVKPVRKYGFDITMYSIDELMKELGYGAISRSMTQANKQLARAVLLVRQSKDAWGDLAKTINTYANQQRVLNDQFTQFKRLLGNVVMGTFQAGDSFEEASKTAGIMQKGIWYLNGAMIAVNTMLDAIVPKVNSFNGAIATGAEDVTGALEEEEEALNSTLASFDKFNSLSGGANGITGGVSEDLQRLLGQETQSYMAQFQERLKDINMYAEQISETILGFLFPEYSDWKGGNENKTFAQWAQQSGVLNEKVKEIKESILTIGRLFAWVINPALGFVTTVTAEMLEATGEERTKMLQDMVETAQGLYAALETIAPALLKIFDAFLPVIEVLAQFISLIAESPSAIWSMVGALLALTVAIQAIKIALSTTTPTKVAEIAKSVAVVAGIAGSLLTIGAVVEGASKRAIKAHAMGGFQTGGLFYAGEAGPEWVGRQGNTSTIINDGQMSDIMRDSVAKGVMQANIASRQISGAGRSSKVAVVNLNGKHLFDVVEQEGYKEGKVFAKSR